MGVVYRAYHPELERTGAVKIMNALSPDRDSVTRFRHEAQAIAKLRHPNIVDVYDFGTFEGTPYMVVEYVPGGSLAARMANGKLGQATALKYLRGIAAGLDYAHAHGVVHRDIKPANVLLSADDTPVLADFGLAKLLQGTSLKSLTGVTTGTPAYMAPEQVAGHQVGPAADRYSLATIAYEMLTGVIPFDGYALMEMLYAHVHNEPPAPSSRLPDLSADVDAVLLRGLAKDPGARWPTATAFVDALEAALTGPQVPQNGHANGVAPVVEKTMVAAPALASTVPMTPRAVAKRARPLPQSATVAIPLTEPLAVPATEQIPRPRVRPWMRPDRRVWFGLAALLVLLLIFGTCEVLAQAVTLEVNPSTASRGDVVTVTATHVPANQVGEIQLWSVVHTFPFLADSNGKVRVYLTVPYDVALGDHTVKICWSDSCHAQQPLRVVSGVAQVLPTPAGNQTPAASPSASATPAAAPTGAPSAAPTAPPTHSSGTPPPTNPPTNPPTPPPTANPCPGNTNTPALTPASQSILLSGGNASVAGSNFTPNSTVTLTYYAPSTGPAYRTCTVTAACNGSFPTQTFATKPTLVLRTDKVVACDVKKGCVSATINIVL